MDYEVFLRRVQETADLPTREEAERIARVVLGTLRERLDRTQRGDLASQLPGELRSFLEAHTGTDRYSLQEFYRRVALRADVSLADGETYARGVVGVLREAVTPGQIADVVDTLPEEYGELFSST